MGLDGKTIVQSRTMSVRAKFLGKWFVSIDEESSARDLKIWKEWKLPLRPLYAFASSHPPWFIPLKEAHETDPVPGWYKSLLRLMLQASQPHYRPSGGSCWRQRQLSRPALRRCIGNISSLPRRAQIRGIRMAT